MRERPIHDRKRGSLGVEVRDLQLDVSSLDTVKQALGHDVDELLDVRVKLRRMI